MSDTQTIEQHFVHRTARVRAVYEQILQAARALGPVREDPKKTSIHLVRKTAFAGVATRKDALVLTIKSAEDIQSSRVVKRNGYRRIGGTSRCVSTSRPKWIVSSRLG